MQRPITLSLALAALAGCSPEPTVEVYYIDHEHQLDPDEPMDFGPSPQEFVASLGAPAAFDRTYWAPGTASPGVPERWTVSMDWGGAEVIDVVERVDLVVDPPTNWYYTIPVLFTLASSDGLRVATSVPEVLRVNHMQGSGYDEAVFLFVDLFRDHGEDGGVDPALVRAIGDSVDAIYDPSTFGYVISASGEGPVSEAPQFKAIDVNFSSGPRPSEGSNAVAGIRLQPTE